MTRGVMWAATGACVLIISCATVPRASGAAEGAEGEKRTFGAERMFLHAAAMKLAMVYETNVLSIYWIPAEGSRPKIDIPKISLPEEELTLRQALERITAQLPGYGFTITPTLVTLAPQGRPAHRVLDAQVSVAFDSVPLDKALARLTGTIADRNLPRMYLGHSSFYPSELKVNCQVGSARIVEILQTFAGAGDAAKPIRCAVTAVGTDTAQVDFEWIDSRARLLFAPNDELRSILAHGTFDEKNEAFIAIGLRLFDSYGPQDLPPFEEFESTYFSLLEDPDPRVRQRTYSFLEHMYNDATEKRHIRPENAKVQKKLLEYRRKHETEPQATAPSKPEPSQSQSSSAEASFPTSWILIAGATGLFLGFGSAAFIFFRRRRPPAPPTWLPGLGGRE